MYENIEKRLKYDRKYYLNHFSIEYTIELSILENRIAFAIQHCQNFMPICLDIYSEDIKKVFIEIFEFLDGNGFWCKYNDKGDPIKMYFTP